MMLPAVRRFYGRRTTEAMQMIDGTLAAAAPQPPA
jgi:hypothetical protein